MPAISVLFFKKSCIIAAGPNIIMSDVSADHPVPPTPTNFCFPDYVAAGGAGAVPVVPPIMLPPTPVFCSIGVPPIRYLCRFCAVVPVVGVWPSSGNVVAYCVIITPSPPRIPSVWGSDSSTLLLPQTSPPLKMVSTSPVACSTQYLDG